MTEKRNKDDHSFFATNVIVELEGVVLQLQNNFEEEEVFPFLRQKLEEHLDQNWTEKSFQEIIKILREEAKLDEEQKAEGFVGIPEGEEEDVKKAVLKNLLWQMDRKKVTEGFKKIRKQIFEHGNFKIKICENVDTRLKTWKDDGKNIFILSSYNLDEQKLLLANTEKGDLLPIFSDLYSTDVGLKNEKETYSNILGKLSCSANDVMFISNKIGNAESASSAGIVAVLISKDGSTQQDTAITYVNSLSDIEFENASKKRKLSKEVEISGSSDDQKLSRPDISNESDVEMMDVSENGIIKEEEGSAEKLKNGLGDIKEIESKELVVKSDTTKGVDDSVKSGNDKTSGDAKNKPNQEKSVGIETDVEDEPKGNLIIRDENKKIAEETTSNGLQRSSIVSETLEGESVCKTEIKPLTEEIKTDKNVENLDKEETNLDTEVSIKPEIKDHENQMSAQSEKEKLVKVDKPSEQNEIIDNSNFPVGLNLVETDEMPANPKNENLVPEKEDKPSKKLEEISLSSETDTDKTNPLKSDVDNPSEDIPKAIEDKVVDELCPSEIKGTTEVVNNVILLAKEHLQEYNTNNTERDDSKTTDDKDKPIDEHSLSSENKTQDINIDTVKSKLEESSEVKIVEVPSSSDSNMESMCTEVEDNQSTSTEKIQQEKISAVKDTDILESNIDLTQKSIAKTEVEDKMDEESSSTEMKSANVDVDTPKTEEVNPSEDKGVNAAQSLESNSVCSDTKTKKLEMDTPSEENGVENQFGQNGVNMKDETENSSEEPVVAQNGIVESCKHINGVNEKLNVENLQCSEKKVENGLTKGTEIEA